MRRARGPFPHHSFRELQARGVEAFLAFLTPDQLALVMGRHYNRAKAPKTEKGVPRVGHQPQKVDDTVGTDGRLAKEYGVSDMTIQRAGKYAAAVDTLRAVDPEIEQKVVTGVAA